MFSEKNTSAECACNITERTEGNNERDFLEREDGHKRKETQAHQEDSSPSPAKPQGSAHKLNQGPWPKVVDFADAFHRTADAEFATGASNYNEKEEDDLQHAMPAQWIAAKFDQQSKPPRK
jgi:hypothetical protein